MGKLRQFVTKIKTIKNIELYVALILGLAVVAIIFMSSSKTDKEKNTVDDTYIGQMEHKICSVVEKVAGCGKASVAISYASNEEKVYAYETEITSSNGVVKQTESLVSFKGEPLVTTVLPPKILGVVVVAEGADDPIVRFRIVNVVVTLLNVREKDVQVLTYKS